MTTTTPTLWLAPRQVNTTDTIVDPFAGSLSGQYGAQVVGLSGGRHVVVWEDDTNTFGGGLGANDIVGQVYDPLGNKVGTEFVVNTVYFDFDQGDPDIIALSNGGFAVAMRTEGDALLNDGQNIIVEVFDEDGVKQSHTDFRQFPNGPSGVDDTNPTLTPLSANNYAIVYEQFDGASNTITGHIVTDGTAGAAFAVADVGKNGRAPDIATLTDGSGNFVVTYEVAASKGATASTAIRAQIHSADGKEVSDFLVESKVVNVGEESDIFGPTQVTALASGGFAVAYQKEGIDGAAGIAVATYQADGTKIAMFDSSTFATTVDGLTEPAIVGLPDGDIVVVWHSNEADEIRGQRLSEDGLNSGKEFVVASTPSAALSSPQATLLSDGRLLISYEADAGGGDKDVFSTIWDPRTAPIEGTPGEDVLTGRIEGGVVNGLGGDDTLYGNAGYDVLQGGRGVDRMEGGKGNDLYYVYEALDQVIETAGNGTADRVAAGVDYVLAADASIERLNTTSLTRVAGIDLTGNKYTQIIQGNYGSNIIDGRGGGDTMYGYLGNDAYFVSSAADIVVEAVNEGVHDRVVARTSYVLNPGSEIEMLRTSSFGSIAARNLTGNEFGQKLYGNDGVNVLNGRGGNDTLHGLGGADVFVFDSKLGPDNVDALADFVSGADNIRLDDAIFTGLATGTLAADAFVEGPAATTADHRIVYDSVAGSLLFDADGNGDGAAVQFATLLSGTVLTADDFSII